MHKYIPVADIELDNAAGFIQKTGALHEAEHLPVGVSAWDGHIDRASLNEWWTDRSIPAGRSGVREALETFGIANIKMLLVRCCGE